MMSLRGRSRKWWGRWKPQSHLPCAKLKRRKWGVLDTIDEESVYVGDVVKAIKRVAPAGALY